MMELDRLNVPNGEFPFNFVGCFFKQIPCRGIALWGYLVFHLIKLCLVFKLVILRL